MRRQIICGVEWVHLESDAVSLAIAPEREEIIASLRNRPPVASGCGVRPMRN